MNKPRPFIHFRQTYEYDVLGVLSIGRWVIPTRVLMPLVGFFLILLIAAAGILHGVTGDGNWWGLVGWYASIVGIISAIGGAIALVSWMVSDTIYANQESK